MGHCVADTTREEASGHFTWEEAGSNSVDGDVFRAKLDGKVFGKLVNASLGGVVGISAGDKAGETGDRAGDDDTGGVFRKASLVEKIEEELDGIKDTADVQVEDFLKGVVRELFNGLGPGGAGVGNDNVDFGGEAVLLVDGVELVAEVFGAGSGGNVGGDGVGLALEALGLGNGVELVDGLFAGISFARADVNTLGAAQKKGLSHVVSKTSRGSSNDSNLSGDRV